MFGVWHDLGEKQSAIFSELRCRVYRWDGASTFPNRTISFVCPSDESPRRFFCEPVMEFQLDPTEKGGLLDQICHDGIGVLYALEKLLDGSSPGSISESDQVRLTRYQFQHAIFRNRLRGRASVKRRLTSYKDFVNSNQFEEIVPTTNEQGKYHRTGMQIVADLQFTVLRDKPTFQGNYCDPNLFEYPRRGLIDNLLVDGAVRKSDAMTFDDACQMMCKSFLAEMELTSDVRLAEEHSAEYRHFCKKLLKSFAKRTPEQFDKWLETERLKSFRRLLPGMKRSNSMDQSKDLALAFDRLLRWDAYQQMARAFGALMLLVWIDFQQDTKIGATEVERSLFSQMHRPQFYLGGLPLAFLTRAQLPWILEPLVRFWNAERFDSESYDAITKLLGIFANTTTEIRKSDRERKAMGRVLPGTFSRGRQWAPHAECVEQSAADVEIDVDDPAEFPPLTSTQCTCGGSLRFLGTSILKDNSTVVELECPNCYKSDYRRISATTLDDISMQYIFDNSQSALSEKTDLSDSLSIS